MKGDIRNSMLLKIICYMLIPILIIVIILSVLYSAYIYENEDLMYKSNFYETNSFGEAYQSDIYKAVSRRSGFDDIELTNGEQIFHEKNYGYYINDTSYVYDMSYNGCENIKYVLIINGVDCYTNMELNEQINSIDDLVNNIKENDNLYWDYDSTTSVISTNINNDILKDMRYSYINDIFDVNSEYQIYTILNNDIALDSELYFREEVFNLVQELQDSPIYLIPISSILLIGVIVYLIASIGHVKGKDGIYLNRFDEMSIDVLLVLGGIAISIVCAIFVQFLDVNVIGKFELVFYIILYSMFIIFLYTIFMILCTTIIKRIKTKTLIKSTLIYKVCSKLIRMIKNVTNNIFYNIDLNARVIIGFFAIVLISVILFIINDIGIILLLLFWGYILYYMIHEVNNFRKIKNSIKDIYDGKKDIKLDSNEFKGDLKDLSIYVNDIAGGFSNAIEESLKSERLKTELITNVSHDIKTPLTSIINYVDLLKKEDLENEKAKEYIEILDKKSQRLKKLTEDLVEASKASSGNVKLQMEKINVKELINQTIGEFKDKFEARNLKLDVSVPDEEILIEADNRYMYRIIENVFSNITKYALENSRVYIDVISQNDKISISIKNISKDKLNISADELMQRFVRGDKSRYTEGSGLGLSISKSLAELQGGTFEIFIDGDLFKVKLEWKKV